MKAGSCDIFIDIVFTVSVLGELWTLYESHGHWESAFGLAIWETCSTLWQRLPLGSVIERGYPFYLSTSRQLNAFGGLRCIISDSFAFVGSRLVGVIVHPIAFALSMA